MNRFSPQTVARTGRCFAKLATNSLPNSQTLCHDSRDQAREIIPRESVEAAAEAGACAGASARASTNTPRPPSERWDRRRLWSGESRVEIFSDFFLTGRSSKAGCGVAEFAATAPMPVLPVPPWACQVHLPGRGDGKLDLRYAVRRGSPAITGRGGFRRVILKVLLR